MSAYDPPWWCPAVDGVALDALAAALSVGGVPTTREQPLAAWTTLGVGGTARLFADIADDAQLGALMHALGRIADDAVPLLIIGRGSNLLISDTGWPGLAIRLGSAFKSFARDGLRVTARGAASMPALAAWTATQGLSGLEFAAGIPATVGGSVRMNAGAHGSEISQRLLGVDLARPGAAGVVRVETADLGFSYRHSVLPTRAIIIGAEWQLVADDPAAIRARLDELRSWRRTTQPLRQRNCGSVFANPEGDSAGRLVDAAGLKGQRCGGAQVSDRHANFIVVRPPCLAADVYQLISTLRRRVHAAGGPLLHPEVRLVGAFGEGTSGGG